MLEAGTSGSGPLRLVHEKSTSARLGDIPRLLVSVSLAITERAKRGRKGLEEMQEEVSLGLALAPGPVDPGSSRLSECEMPNQPRSEAWMGLEGLHTGDLWDSRLTPQSIVSAFSIDQQESGLHLQEYTDKDYADSCL